MNSTVPGGNQTGSGRRIRALVVDDSALLRKLVTQAIESDPAIEVVGSAPNGVIALQRIPQVNPDVMILDIEMPEMDGIETLRRVRAAHPELKVIMCSTLTERGASITIEALMLGANDYVYKGAHGIATMGHQESSLQVLRNELIPKIKQFFLGKQGSVMPPVGATISHPPAPVLPVANRVLPVAQPDVVVIGVSTGGPTALHEIIPQIPAHFPLPILIVQHMPPLFTRLLAERLASRSHLKVEEAREGQAVEAGRVYVAPGDYHMRAVGQPGKARIALDQGPSENSCRPAVDVLFRSAVEVWGSAIIGVILTGMGADGLVGCEKLHAKGGYILAQDEASSVVWGMPGFVARAGLADRVVPLNSIVPEILERCQPAIRAALRPVTPVSPVPGTGFTSGSKSASQR